MGATTAKRAQPRRTPAPKKAATKASAVRPVTAADEYEPIRLVTPEQPPDIELVELFSIDGRAYTVPREVSPSVALRFMKVARRAGMELAMSGLLEEMLGEEAYDALMNFPYLTRENLADLMDLVRRHAMGAVEAPKERSKSA